MKTLKLQLLAASMFACTTAFAQGTANGVPSLGTAPAPNANASNFATGPNANSNSQSFNSSRANYVNDAYVLQQGTSQYATVNQTGGLNGGSPAASNQSDLLQVGGRGNNAFVTQTYNGAGGAPKNIAYIRQDGIDGTATQIQEGSSNTASIEQIGNGFSTGNTAYQNQQGDEHKASIRQENGDRDQAIQFQNGRAQYSVIDQNGASPSRAETVQSGMSNAAFVTQH